VGEAEKMKSIKVYLSGSIKKGPSDTEKEFYWTDSDVDYITSNLDTYSVEILNPATAKVTRNDPFENFGCDAFLVKSSDFLIADMRERRGIGVGGEMVLAKLYGIPVVSICPRESHYRKSEVKDVCGEDLKDWTHPFVLSLSDAVVEDLPEAVLWIKDFLSKPKPVKGIEIIEESIQHYKRALSKRTLSQ
jgi:hypothetical protein